MKKISTIELDDEIKNKIANLTMPTDVSISYDGNIKYPEEAFGSL